MVSFDSIPHAELMKSVARRVSDKVMLHLIKQWREAAVEEEDDERGNRKRNTHNRDTRRGTPQGAPISPLLSNLYMRRFIVWWKQRGGVQRWAAHIVSYADDFVICCKRQAEQALQEMRRMMGKLKLKVSEEKTHLGRSPREKFDFLGYTFGRGYSPKTGRATIGPRPSKKSIQRRVASLSEQTDRRNTWLTADEIAGGSIAS